MSSLTALRRVRLEQVRTQQMLAVKVGVSQAKWSKYENGEIDMPEDVAMKTLIILGDARLKAIYQHEKGIGVFNTPILTEIDEKPYTVLNVVMQESLEMIRSAETLKRLIRMSEVFKLIKTNLVYVYRLINSCQFNLQL